MPKIDPNKTVEVKFTEEGYPILSEVPLEHFNRIPAWVLHLSQLPQAQRNQSIPYLQMGSVERNCDNCMHFNKNTEDSMRLSDGRVLGFCEWNRSTVGSHNLCPSFMKGNPDHVN